MDFQLGSGCENDTQLRKAFRTSVPGLTVRVENFEQVYPVQDISATGFAIHTSKKSYEEGQHLEVSLYINKKLFMDKLETQVVRVLENGVVGINFIDVEKHKQARLDKLVLEVQKRRIELRKKQKEQG